MDSSASTAQGNGSGQKAWTVRDVAARLAVNERTVYRLAQAGELPGIRVAGTWRFLPEDLAIWIEAQ